MGRKNRKPKEPQEKVITGSGADVVSHEDEHGRVKCKCIVPCVWRGYRDEGDTVWIEKELIEKDAFIRAHFKAVEPLPEGQRRQDGEEDRNETAAGGEGETGDHYHASRGGRDGTDEGEGDGGDGNGQGELGLK